MIKRLFKEAVQNNQN